MKELGMLGLLLLVCLHSGDRYVSAAQQNVLVMGGNGFIGASVVVQLVDAGHKVTMVSRGNWYWDSKERARGRVDRFIECDRKTLVEEPEEGEEGEGKKCAELQEFISSTEHFDAIYDFSVHDRHDIKAMLAMLKDKVGLYILVSSGSVYDVCKRTHDGGPVMETDAVRPATQNERNVLNNAHSQGHAKMSAEEQLMEQRLTDAGVPFIILRMPDVFGPRDTTYRFAIYHLWAKLSEHLPANPVMLPAFLKDFQMSLVYSEDVADMLAKLLDFGPQIKDQAINLAYAEAYTGGDLVQEIQKALGQTPGERLEYWPADYHKNFYLYPTVRLGPLDVTKAKSLLAWKPTPFTEAVKSTADFYEEVMAGDTFENQRNEIVQIVGSQLYAENLEQFWGTLEKVYSIDLKHFRPRDEL